MISTQLLVPPQLPTTLAGDTHVELPGYDVWLFDSLGVYVIPTEIDVQKFNDALSCTLQLYPHAAGQLRCSDGRWSIELTNSAIPVEIVQKIDMTSDSLLDGDWVIQDNIFPFLTRRQRGAYPVNGDAPLLRLKLTFLHHETSIGITWNHSLGDGVALLRFFHTLSQFYQGLPSKFTVPTFRKQHFPIPSRSTMADLSPSLPLILTDKFDKVARAESLQNLVQVRWRMNDDDLEMIRSALLPNKQNRNFLSKLDCLIAYIVSVLNLNRTSGPMQRVTNTSSYRHAKASFVDENVAGNMLIMASANIPADMAGIATAVRGARLQSREPYYIYMLGMLMSKIMLDSANAGMPPPLQMGDDELFVNSQVSMDLQSAHFGHPDGTRVFIEGMNRYCLRVLKSNPMRGVDGVWRRDRQSVDILLGVPTELSQGIMDTLARGVQYVLNNHRARL